MSSLLVWCLPTILEKIQVNKDHGHIPAPRIFIKNQGMSGTLPGFPKSKYVGKHNDGRHRWDLPDKKFLTWDTRHGTVDLFDKYGKNNLGKYKPDTGSQLKEGKPERTSKPS